MSVVRELMMSYLNKVFPCLGLKPQDRLVAVYDAGIDSRCQVALRSAVAILREQGIQAQLCESSIPSGSAQDLGQRIEGQMQGATALFYHTSKSRSHCPQTRKFVLDQRAARCLSITNGSAETLLVGAVNEDIGIMRRRINHINNLTQRVERFHITTPAGTNLWVTPWPEMMVVDDGRITQPGLLGNFPFGEGCSCAVKFQGTTGVIVSDGVVGSGIGRVGSPIIMEIIDGQIIHMEGEGSMQTLKAAMDEADSKLPSHFAIPNASYWIAEVAFGMNAAAWRVDDTGKMILPPTSLEAEKAYNQLNTSMHIANGANYAFGVPPDHPYYNPVQHHTDHVLCGGVTVDAYFAPDEPSIRLIDNGKPIY